jgi:hypothetical protein
MVNYKKAREENKQRTALRKYKTYKEALDFKPFQKLFELGLKAQAFRDKGIKGGDIVGKHDVLWASVILGDYRYVVRREPKVLRSEYSWYGRKGVE